MFSINRCLSLPLADWTTVLQTPKTVVDGTAFMANHFVVASPGFGLNVQKTFAVDGFMNVIPIFETPPGGEPGCTILKGEYGPVPS